MNKVTSNILAYVLVAILGLVWALALKLPIIWMVIGCCVAYFIFSMIIPNVFKKPAMSGCAMMAGSFLYVLIAIGLIVLLIRYLTKC